MRDQLLHMARGVLDLVDDDGGHGENVDDLIAAASAGDELASAVLAYLSTRMSVTQRPLANVTRSRWAPGMT
jgi:hypothetical protein